MESLSHNDGSFDLYPIASPEAFRLLLSARLWPFWAGWRTAFWRSAVRGRCRLEADPRHQPPRHRRAVDRGREPAIVGDPVRRAAHPRQHRGDDLLEQLAVDRHDD